MIRRWWADTLFKRLFILMWVALVASHLMAFNTVRLLGMLGHEGHNAFELRQFPVLPSLPPTPGMPGGQMGEFHGAPPHPGDAPPFLGERGGQRPPALPMRTMLVDYGVRVLLIGLAAWLGARWLSQPMRRLVSASQSLAGALGRDAPLPALDERRGTQEVRETAHVFNEMAQRLDEQFRARGLMAAAISHDLRTPLTRMRMRLESMEGEPAQRCIADVREMNELIDSALRLFRDASFREPMQSTDILALVQSLADDLVEQGHRVQAGGDAACVQAQPAALRRALGNLLANAVRYGDHAAVTVVREGDGVRIVIEDAGPGIPSAQLDAVFQPFYRVEGSRSRHTGGMGLGLYIARDLILRQHGSLALANRAEGGLRATVTLGHAAV